MKRAVALIGSACWFLFAIGFGVLLVQYLCQGAGLQHSGWLFSNPSLFIGMVHVVGLALASLVSIAISAALWVRAFAPAARGRSN
jgi:hypothetical protein